MDPRSIRTFNPGAMNYGPFAQANGAIGSDGRLAIFPTPEAGFGAMGKLLDTYQSKHGLNTVSGILNRWAPPNVDNNSTGQYVKFVAGKLGIDPNAPIPPEQRPALMQAMAHYEAGRPFPASGGQPQALPAPQPSPASQPQQQSPLPMAQPEETGLVGMFRNFSENPLLLAGLGLMSASGQGKDVGTGLMQGMQMAQQGLKSGDERRKKSNLQQLLAGGAGMEGVPAPLLNIARATEDPGILAQYALKKEFSDGTGDIKEFEYAKKQGFGGTFADWMTQKRAAGGYGKTPIYGVGPDGKPVIMQIGSEGKAIQTQMPEGVQISRDPIKLDAGTHFVIIDPITRQPVATIPKDVAGAASQKAVGEARGQAQVDLPKVESSSQALLDKIGGVANDPNLGNVTGWQANFPTFMPSSHDTEAKIAQLGGSAFLQAFESLKGGGAITEMEGQKATAAMARLTNLKQSDAGFKQALEDFKSEVVRLQQLARTRAGGGQAQQPAPMAPPPPSAPAMPEGWSIQRVK